MDELRSLGCVPINATALFTEPGRGMRLVNDADQLACFEFAAAHGSEVMRRLLTGGSNIARGGFLASTERELPDAASDYVARLVAPYFASTQATSSTWMSGRARQFTQAPW